MLFCEKRNCVICSGHKSVAAAEPPPVRRCRVEISHKNTPMRSLKVDCGFWFCFALCKLLPNATLSDCVWLVCWTIMSSGYCSSKLSFSFLTTCVFRRYTENWMKICRFNLLRSLVMIYWNVCRTPTGLEAIISRLIKGDANLAFFAMKPDRIYL